MGGVEGNQSQSVATTDDATGTYYWDMMNRVLSVTVKGSSIVTIRTQDAVKISLRIQVTMQNFFATKTSFIDLLAGSLNIPPSRIRIAQVVRPARRRALLTSELDITVAVLPEISASPPPPGPSSPPPPIGTEASEAPDAGIGSADAATQTITPVAVLNQLTNLGNDLALKISDGSLQKSIISSPILLAVLTVPVQTVTPEISVAPAPECIPTCKNATVAQNNGVYGSCSASGTCECLKIADGTVSSDFTYVTVSLGALGSGATTAAPQGCFWCAFSIAPFLFVA